MYASWIPLNFIQSCTVNRSAAPRITHRARQFGNGLPEPSYCWILATNFGNEWLRQVPRLQKNLFYKGSPRCVGGRIAWIRLNTIHNQLFKVPTQVENSGPKWRLLNHLNLLESNLDEILATTSSRSLILMETKSYDVAFYRPNTEGSNNLWEYLKQLQSSDSRYQSTLTINGKILELGLLMGKEEAIFSQIAIAVVDAGFPSMLCKIKNFVYCSVCSSHATNFHLLRLCATEFVLVQ